MALQELWEGIEDQAKANSLSHAAFDSLLVKSRIKQLDPIACLVMVGLSAGLTIPRGLRIHGAAPEDREFTHSTDICQGLFGLTKQGKRHARKTRDFSSLHTHLKLPNRNSQLEVYEAVRCIEEFEMISTSRLLIRPFQEQDCMALFAYLSNPLVYRFELGEPISLEEAKALTLERTQTSDF